MKPITSVRLEPIGSHIEVTVWVNHALAGTLLMRPEEAEEFRAGQERVERLEAAARGLIAAIAAYQRSGRWSPIEGATEALRAALAPAPEGSDE